MHTKDTPVIGPAQAPPTTSPRSVVAVLAAQFGEAGCRHAAAKALSGGRIGLWHRWMDAADIAARTRRGVTGA